MICEAFSYVFVMRDICDVDDTGLHSLNQYNMPLLVEITKHCIKWILPIATLLMSNDRTTPDRTMTLLRLCARILKPAEQPITQRKRPPVTVTSIVL